MKIRIIILILISMFSNVTHATSKTFELDNFSYKVTNNIRNEIEVCKAPNNVKQITIPKTIIYEKSTYYITSIGEKAFFNNPELTSIILPNTLTSIKDLAFSGCTSLQNIILPNDISQIGAAAFQDCSSLTSIQIPNNVKIIEKATFNGCRKLTSIKLSNNITIIKENAFRDCDSLITIILPNTITTIEDFAFEDCSALTSIDIPENTRSLSANTFRNCSSLISINVSQANLTYTSLDGVLFNKNLSEIIFYPNAKKGPYMIPDGVKSIANRAFWGNKFLTEIYLPKSIYNIGEAAFQFCESLHSINLPNTITIIESATFSNCRSLQSIIIPNGVNQIMKNAFQDCKSLKSIILPASLKYIEKEAFKNCQAISFIQCEALYPPTINNSKETDVFEGIHNNIPIYVPSISIENYKWADGWSKFQNFQAITTNISKPEEIKNIHWENGYIYNPSKFLIKIYNINGNLINASCQSKIYLSTGQYIIHYDNQTLKINI